MTWLMVPSCRGPRVACPCRFWGLCDAAVVDETLEKQFEAFEGLAPKSPVYLGFEDAITETLG